jgi:hypothetical protein
MRLRTTHVLLSVLSMSISGSSISSALEPSLATLLTKKVIHIRDLTNLHMNVQQGHGSVYWAKLDEGNEIWFWYQPGLRSALGFGKIVLVAEVPQNDENKGTILWPSNRIGRDYGQELEVLYPR